MRTLFAAIRPSFLTFAALLTLNGTAQADAGLLLFAPDSSVGRGYNVSVYVTNPYDFLYAQTRIDTSGSSPGYVAVRGDQAFAYVTNMSSNDVSVIDASTFSVVQTVPTGTQPLGLATSPNGKSLYVCNSRSNTVSVFSIDTDTGLLTAVTTISVGRSPRGIAISSDSARAYAVNQGGDTVSVIDTSTNTVLATIAVGTQPTSAAVNPDGTRVYVTSLTSQSVSVINTSTNTVLETVPIGANCVNVGVSPNGDTFYTANFSSGTLSQFSTATDSEIDSPIPAGNLANGIAINPDGLSLYTSTAGSIAMFTIDSAGSLATYGTVDGANSPGGLGMATNGNALLAAGATFLANDASALGSTGAEGPIFTGGTLRLHADYFLLFTPVSLGTAGGTIDTHGHDGEIDGVISGDGALAKTGDGGLILNASNTFTGGTAVHAGTLLLANPSGSATGDGAVNLDSGATLAGAGAATGIVTLQDLCTLAPTADGALALGALSWNGQIQLSETIGGTAPTPVQLTGALSHNGRGSCTLALSDGGVAPRQTYTLISFASTSGVSLSDFTVTGLTGTLALTANALTFTTSSTAPTYGVTMSAAKGKDRATFTIANTGSTTTGFRLARLTKIANAYNGPKPTKPGKSPFKIVYTLGGADITSALEAGTALTSIPAGGSAQVLMKIKSRDGRTVHFQRTIHATLSATSTVDPSKAASATVKLTLKADSK